MKIGVCAHLGIGIQLLDGQVIKSCTFLNEMSRIYGQKEVSFCDTRNWQRHPLQLILNCIKLARECKNIVILPAEHGVQVFSVMFVLFKAIFNFKLHYVVVGGWLPELLVRKHWLKFWLKKFDCIYVELHSMRVKLNTMGLNNVYEMVTPNYRKFELLTEHQIPNSSVWQGQFCYYSRIVKEKGIEDAVTAIENSLNEKNVHLDIYGQIDAQYKETFNQICIAKEKFVTYKGIIPFGKSLDVLKNYTAVLFPTYYDGEGFAGIFIDAMAAGLPIVASDWHANSEIIKDMDNGMVFAVHDVVKLQNSIEKLVNSPELVLQMKKNCLTEVVKYEPDNVLKVFIKQLR